MNVSSPRRTLLRALPLSARLSVARSPKDQSSDEGRRVASLPSTRPSRPVCETNFCLLGSRVHPKSSIALRRLLFREASLLRIWAWRVEVFLLSFFVQDRGSSQQDAAPPNAGCWADPGEQSASIGVNRSAGCLPLFAAGGMRRAAVVPCLLHVSPPPGDAGSGPSSSPYKAFPPTERKHCQLHPPRPHSPTRKPRPRVLPPTRQSKAISPPSPSSGCAEAAAHGVRGEETSRLPSASTGPVVSASFLNL